MNPLCCIAPVSIERDRANPTVVKPQQNESLGFENAVAVRPVSFNSRQSFSAAARISSVNAELDLAANGNNTTSNCNNLAEENLGEAKAVYSGKNVSVAGVLYKWVNYGKGWRARWFVLEDGVLSYYKVHGPDKIVMGPGGEKGVKVIGQESWRYMRKASGNWTGSNNQHLRLNGYAKQWKPFGEVHLKVSSVRASKSDDKRLSIFTGTKTLHLRCPSREDRTAWIEALLVAKDRFPRMLSSSDFGSSEEFVISTEKLRLRLLQEGIGEPVVKDCESIMLNELAELQNQLKALQVKHLMLLDRLRQLETEKIELETTVVDETKERDSCYGGNRRFSDFYSIMSEGSASDSGAENESRDGGDVETDEEDGVFFDTKDFLSAELLRSASYQ